MASAERVEECGVLTLGKLVLHHVVRCEALRELSRERHGGVLIKIVGKRLVHTVTVIAAEASCDLAAEDDRTLARHNEWQGGGESVEMTAHLAALTIAQGEQAGGDVNHLDSDHANFRFAPVGHCVHRIIPSQAHVSPIHRPGARFRTKNERAQPVGCRLHCSRDSPVVSHGGVLRQVGKGGVLPGALVSPVLDEDPHGVPAHRVAKRVVPAYIEFDGDVRPLQRTRQPHVVRADEIRLGAVPEEERQQENGWFWHGVLSDRQTVPPSDTPPIFLTCSSKV